MYPYSESSYSVCCISLLKKISEGGKLGISWRALVNRAWSQLSPLWDVLIRAASPALWLSPCHTGRVLFASRDWAENEGIVGVYEHKGLYVSVLSWEPPEPPAGEREKQLSKGTLEKTAILRH